MVKGLGKDKKEYFGVKVVRVYPSGKRFSKIIEFVYQADYEKAKEKYGVNEKEEVVLLND